MILRSPHLKRVFNLQIGEETDLFAHVEGLPPSETLRAGLAETTELALAINTEKGHSELMIMPILLELRRQKNYQMGLCSGIDFNVDPA